MGAIFGVDWRGVFAPRVPLAEVVVRGSLVYLALIVMMRLARKRAMGTVGMADLLMIVLIADAAQNAMAAGYRSVTDGVVLVATLLAWNQALDWLGDRSDLVRRLVRPPSLLLVRDGRMLRKNMRFEMISEEELRSVLRKQGIDDLGRVKEARMEPDGAISVVERAPGG
ncbi:MAG TPA: YetF domain-containing protein [Isosphaeraceae bacterium]|jgi:uncharacterized membrane protein YcaP (DUF421 family)|nr:YetF domain-containing protein [Isosphaeraceae bacterium]